MNRKYKTKGTQEPTPRIRVAREHYERIIDLADECDMKLIDVLNQLLDFALEYAEVEEIQIPVKSLRVGGEKDGKRLNKIRKLKTSSALKRSN